MCKKIELKDWQKKLLAGIMDQSEVHAYLETMDLGNIRFDFHEGHLHWAVFYAVVLATSESNARERLGGLRATLDALCMELDERIDHISDRSVETPLGEQIDGGGEIEEK